MSKIAMIGSIHADGWSILEKKDCDVFEITDFWHLREYHFSCYYFWKTPFSDI